MTNTRKQNIVDTLLTQWKSGIILDDDAKFFLDSTFGINSGDDLQKILSRETTDEREMILEMLLFPDHAARLAIESFLDSTGMAQCQIDELAAPLADKGRVKWVYSETASSIDVPVPHSQVRIYLDRLYLKKSLVPKICILLSKIFSEEIAVSSRVVMRCTNTNLKGPEISFLMRFIRRAGESLKENAFTPLFERTVSILSEMPDVDQVEQIERYFQDKREAEKKMLDGIRQFEEKRDRYGMEYLMMSKYPVPPDSPEVILERIEQLTIIIDEILSLFPIRSGPAPIHRHLGELHPQQDMASI